ncbi:vWA domain-containing protein [Faunimonas sp. B44]|uniref:vWA domain-containing protein n=1 Tax=Faunimonas sp. B44 TaxID=3461493 RepID=UPI00404498C3
MLRSLRRKDDGNIAIMFAFSLIPIMGLMGIAVDYTRASDARVRMQTALDSVALTAAKASRDMSDAQLRTMVEERLAALLPAQYYTFQVSEFSRDQGTVQIAATGQLKSTLTGVLGSEHLNIAASSEATWSTGKMEIVLAVDDTGSMNQHNRLIELKKAATALLDSVQSSDPDLVKVGLVPFNTQVRLNTSYKDQTWLKFRDKECTFLEILFGTCKTGANSEVTKANWAGCITDRGENPYTTNVSGKDYDTNDLQGSGDAFRYTAVVCATTKLPEIVPLNTNLADLRVRINNMQADGNTNITIGLAWGQTLLSPEAPFTQGVAWGTEDVSKVLILITDGDNTENRWTKDQTRIDQRTSLACDAVKAKKILLYTVRLQEGNQTLLRQCATSTDHYFNVENVNDLVPAFQAIGAQLSELRISK